MRCFIIFPLFILASAKKQLWLPELSCTDYVPDLSDPPGDLFGMELSCIDNNSTLKLPTLLSPFSGTFTLQSPVSESERESLYSGMNSQRAECENLKTERQKLDFLSPYSMKVIKANPESCLMLTGLKLRTLVVMIDYLSKGEKDDGRISREDMEGHIILTIVKLKHNQTFEMLAHLFRISKTTAIDCFWKWLNSMYTKLKFLIKMQDCDNIFKTIPLVFTSKFLDLTSIIDCFEVFIESPGARLAGAQCYISFKKHCTIKVFISCKPLGIIVKNKIFTTNPLFI